MTAFPASGYALPTPAPLIDRLVLAALAGRRAFALLGSTLLVLSLAASAFVCPPEAAAPAPGPRERASAAAAPTLAAVRKAIPPLVHRELFPGVDDKVRVDLGPRGAVVVSIAIPF